MKKVLILMLFVSNISWAQSTHKMEVIVPATATDNEDGLKVELKKPDGFYNESIRAINQSSSYGFGIRGSHAGSGIGIYGNSLTGVGIKGTTGLGVSIVHSGGGGTLLSSGVFGYSSNNQIGVKGFSESGPGGFFSSNTGQALVTGTGKVGINIDPAAKLHIGGAEAEKLRLENTTSLDEDVTIAMYFKTGAYFTGAIKTIGGNTAAARLGFFTYADSSPSALEERMSISDAGRVGIGVTSPLARLDIKNDVDLSTAIIRGTVYNSTFSKDLDEHTYINGGKNNSNVYINDNALLGRVAIGAIPNPDQILDVNGRARIRHTIISNVPYTSGIWMSNSLNSINGADGAFYGMKNDIEAGIYIGNAWRWWVNNAGNMTVGGSVTASCGLLVCSDLRYKRNIIPLNNSLENIYKINGVRYDFRKEEFPERNFSDKPQIGFIAQDIEKIFPEMVFTDEKGYKSVDYARLTPVLVEALKELTLKNQTLENKNQTLESRLDKIEALLSNIQPNTENSNSKK